MAPEPAGPADLSELISRWAAGLRDVPEGSAEWDRRVADLARELHDDGRWRSGGRAEERFAHLYRKLPAGVVLTGADGRIEAANPEFVRLAGATGEEQVRGRDLAGFGAGERDREALRGVIAATVRLGVEEGRDTVDLRGLDGDTRAVRISTTTFPGEDHGHSVVMLEDVQELQRLRKTLQHQGLHDPLTGLPNGAYFRSRLAAVLAEDSAQRIALWHVDVDGFHVINDGLGPASADRVMLSTANTLRDVFAERGGFLARLAGDAFVVALRGDLDPAAVVAIAEEAIDRLAQPVPIDGIGVGVSASIGIVLTGVPEFGCDELMRSAELALHRAKELGKAQWVLHDSEFDRASRDRHRLACSIAGALRDGEITVAYQPHVVLPDGAIIVSVNAALRWEHPELGRLRPDQFYPPAETTGMTVPLGRHLLAEALDTAADWRARFGTDAPTVCLTLPRRVAVDADLIGIVRAELDRTGLAAEHLMLCTEGLALLDDRGDVAESIGHLAGLGVIFVLDIAGPSELELVPALRLPVGGVMLRGPMVEELDVDEPPEWAVRGLRQLVERAEELGVKVGAHGITSAEHAQRLFDAGVVVGAGPYLPEHLTRADAEQWVGKSFFSQQQPPPAE